MGDEVRTDHFTEDDYRQFEHKLQQEMDFMRQLFADRQFDNQGRKFGYELELCLLDNDGHPAPLNEEVLKQADNHLFTFELAKFNLEINGNCFEVSPGVFDQIEQDLHGLYHEVEQAAARFDTQVGMFGVLPSLSWQHLDPEHYMSNMYRYRQLNHRLMQMRERPVHMEIHGEEYLSVEKQDVMLEALSTSLQMHIQVPFDEAVDTYHAALWSSMAVMAVSANSPLVLQKSCWQESRVAIFKQSVDTRNPQEQHDSIIPRVHFSKGYIESFQELFDDNDYYSPILPEVMDCAVGKMHHFNLHNGTIWRWIRPILGQDDGKYHLRLELRVTPSGPTLIDTLANMVFHIGLTEGLKLTPQDLTRIPFEQLEHDFYRVAREGLQAQVNWCHGEVDTIQNLLLQRALPVAVQGLQELGITDAGRWLDIIQQRVSSGQTGSQWILDYWHKNPDSAALVKAYLELAGQNVPVHQWPRP